MTARSDHWIEVGDRVLVRRHTELDLSTGLMLGERSCLVVDTRGDPAQGAELAVAVREVTPLPGSVVLTHAHPLRWPTTLTALLALGAAIVVPGHGEPVDVAFVTAQRDELAELAALCRAVRNGEHGEHEALDRSPFGETTTRIALARAGNRRVPPLRLP